MVLILTTSEVVKSTIIYGIVHLFYVSLRWFFKQVAKEMESERAKIIKSHKRNGHIDRFYSCSHPDCLQGKFVGDS